MRLQDLFAGVPLQHPIEANSEVTGLSHDSRRRVGVGDLFVAIHGESFDGKDFARQAAEQGAVAVFGTGSPPSGLPIPWLEIADSVRPWIGLLASRVYDNPHEKLRVVGITGTNGKSTVTTLIARVFEAAGLPAGRLGTLGYHFNGKSYGDAEEASLRTTPEATDLFRILEEMRRDGARAVAMEVSSHALAMGRVEGLRFDSTVFTNLTHDHLDFHGDLESYFAAKATLFEPSRLKAGGKSVVHIEDPFGQRLATQIGDCSTFGSGGKVSIVESNLSLLGIRARIQTPRGELSINSPLIGRFNLENLLATVAAAEALGLPHEAITDGIAAQGPLPGRLEPIEAGQPFPVFVDFAHTPAGLEAALNALQELGDHQIILVFGCGGDRDREKRSAMGEIAGRGAGLPVATSDNPRTEDPLAILTAIEIGLKASGNASYRLMPDRREAIRRATSIASSQPEKWALLVTGKGHEEVQILGDRHIPFSDRRELETSLAGLGFTGVAHG